MIKIEKLDVLEGRKSKNKRIHGKANAATIRHPGHGDKEDERGPTQAKGRRARGG